MCFLSVSCFGASMFCAKDALDFCVFESKYFLGLCFLVISTYDFVHVKIIAVTFFWLFFLTFYLWPFYTYVFDSDIFTCDFFTCDFLNSCHKTNIRSNNTESQVGTFQGKTNLSHVLVCLFFCRGFDKVVDVLEWLKKVALKSWVWYSWWKNPASLRVC